jgi:hypothetical protein
MAQHLHGKNQRSVYGIIRGGEAKDRVFSKSGSAGLNRGSWQGAGHGLWSITASLGENNADEKRMVKRGIDE